MLACLERLCAETDSRGRLDAGAAAELMALFTHFADGLHQEREERCLFPRLLARAHSVEERMHIARLVGEHENERRALRGMQHELMGAVFGEAHSLNAFRREAGRYLDLQRSHVLHENRELLSVAERLLLPEDDETVMRGFLDLEQGSAVKLKQILERIRALCAHLRVELVETA